MHWLVRKANSATFRYMENRWRWHPDFRNPSPATPIDRPIFLLGIGGSGLTLTARILRRTPCVVSATGNWRYWAGNDEMQNVVADHLMESFTWRKLDAPGFLSRHDNCYACDALIDAYTETAADETPEKRACFRSTLQGFIAMNRDPESPETPRFLDKSQTFTLRTGLIASILDDTRPKFVYMSRNPYAICWRNARKAETVADLSKSEEEKLTISVEHWANSANAALEAAKSVDLSCWRFEDLLREPERVIREICTFAELPYSSAILPGPDDHIPWGSAYDAFDRHKWYPLRADVSSGYLREIPAWAIDKVTEGCGPLLERLGYAPPTPEA